MRPGDRLFGDGRLDGLFALRRGQRKLRRGSCDSQFAEALGLRAPFVAILTQVVDDVAQFCNEGIGCGVGLGRLLGREYAEGFDGHVRHSRLMPLTFGGDG
jgi:hypothetical protein